MNSIKIPLIQTQFACKRLCKFRSLGRDSESHAFKTVEFGQLKAIGTKSYPA